MKSDFENFENLMPNCDVIIPNFQEKGPNSKTTELLVGQTQKFECRPIRMYKIQK